MKRWKLFITIVALVILVIFLTIFINQSLNLLASLYKINPLLGQVSGAILLTFYLIAFIFIVYMYWQMPKALPKPPAKDTIEYQKYLLLIENRLKKNESLKQVAFDKGTSENVNIALQKLNTQADDEIKSAAKKVFLFTSISQYGKLDGIVVFIILIKLTTKIAFLYNQRPSIKELLNLYINVFATVFFVTEMEDIEIIESQLEPLMENFSSSFTVAIAGSVSTLGTIFANAVFQGAINTFLVMRVGFIAKQYSLPLQEPQRILILKGATIQASKMLGSILSGSIKSVANLFITTTTKRTTDFAKSSYNSCVTVMDNAWDKVTDKISVKKNKKTS